MWCYGSISIKRCGQAGTIVLLQCTDSDAPNANTTGQYFHVSNRFTCLRDKMDMYLKKSQVSIAILTSIFGLAALAVSLHSFWHRRQCDVGVYTGLTRSSC